MEAGVDDYLAKPFAMDELAARVRALGRRKATAPRRTAKLGGLTLDLEALAAITSLVTLVIFIAVNLALARLDGLRRWVWG